LEMPNTADSHIGNTPRQTLRQVFMIRQ
jgi:hypothetical protein